MPEISRFYGITIYMFYNEHNPPHIHVQYQDYGAVIEIESGKLKGKFPRRALNLITEWIQIHKKELNENWELSRKRIPLKSIKPLD
ncbi:MAG: DUF4160 domain-containing protein [Ignavibacteria bacterium]|nr:DUF4160 domain-containing protein [Ignavibacteria bacterium]